MKNGFSDLFMLFSQTFRQKGKVKKEIGKSFGNFSVILQLKNFYALLPQKYSIFSF